MAHGNSFGILFLFTLLLILLVPGPAEAQMDMLPQIFRDLPPELQEGLPKSMEYKEYRRLNRNVDFFTMSMASIVPGYAHFQVEKPMAAWTIVGTRVAGYAMMATAIGRQWEHWRDLNNLDSIPEPRYQRYQENLFLFASGIVVNGMAWALDVMGAYHVAKREKNLVMYKYGLQESLSTRGEEGDIEFIRRLILQENKREWQIREELYRSLLRYIETYPAGVHRGEVEFYLGTLYAGDRDFTRVLLHFARNLSLFPQSRFTHAARRSALAIIQQNRSRWSQDWKLLISKFSETSNDAESQSLEARYLSYLRSFQELKSEEFRRLYVEEAVRVAKENPESDFADDALFGAATQLETLGEAEKAVITYTQLAGVYPESEHFAQSLLRTAELLIDLGDPEYARRFYERLISARPRSPEAEAARKALERWQ